MEQLNVNSGETGRSFLALSRICLNNWHYINKKTLSFCEDINFFTGHSGSGKSTVIDALQIVLYANTDGRSFFNKAAADDSDRSLIEYLRGMVNIGDNNEFSYLRNHNFSSTIVLELRRPDTGECQCVGIVFDVDTATNEARRRFFRHEGPLWESGYRTGNRVMSIDEIEGYLQEHYEKDAYFYTSHNERFRRLLYDVYLGGLDSEKFPLLFKRAIPFRMNIKLEDFVKEYICMEQDIHIEDMQESVMQYGRMRKKIEDTCIEIEELRELGKKYLTVSNEEETLQKLDYFIRKSEILDLREQGKELAARIEGAKADWERLKEQKRSEEIQIKDLTRQSDELLRQIASTGFEELRGGLFQLNELSERLLKSEVKWQETANGLRQWTKQDITSNQTIWEIEEFESGTISAEKLERLKKSIAEMVLETKKQSQEVSSFLRELGRREKEIREDLTKLKEGKKAYPKYLEYARSYIQGRLLKQTGKPVEVNVLADLLDIEDSRWQNAVEGYLGGNKLALVVPPEFSKMALELYSELDKKEYHRVTVLDTEQASKGTPQVFEQGLSNEVSVQEPFLRSYVDLLLGKVIKCENIEELRQHKIGITPDCMLYHTFRLQNINPDQYTKFAAIGRSGMKKRIRMLEQELSDIEAERKPQEAIAQKCAEILRLESLKNSVNEYLEWKKDREDYKEKQKEKRKLEQKLEKLKEQNVEQWEQERNAILTLCDGKKAALLTVSSHIDQKEAEIANLQKSSIELQEALVEKEQNFVREEVWEAEYAARYAEGAHGGESRKAEYFVGLSRLASERREAAFGRLLDARIAYVRKYPNRNLSPGAKDNAEYDRLLSSLECEDLEKYKEIAAEQAEKAVEHFKDDFMYKIRSAIREALLRKDELNRVIDRLDFGKDKYQFVIGKNKGADGRYFDMFMDESLEVNPSKLNHSFDNQLNLFTMDHENQYGEQINELINIFIPAEGATPEEMEEAKRNMDKYADYRTYLSFDMQQIIKNDDGVIKLRLSRMLRKNSGGEGQNPLYVALLASFAQAYRINLSPRLKRNPTIRLVVLDEAFSKMDAEKVASCIELIRGLGFQAIISATNDKIQNYVENVDKTFVFANPNKKAISIQEFEKEKLPELIKELEFDT